MDAGWLFDRWSRFPDRTAVIDAGRSYRYDAVGALAAGVAGGLLDRTGDLAEARVAYLLPPGLTHVAVQWGIWRAGGVAVPLAPSHPAAELDYILEDAAPRFAIGEPESPLRALAERRGIDWLDSAGFERADRTAPALPLGPERRALMVYTSGTTGRPKGVVTTHGMIDAQIRAMVEAWEWAPDDRSLHILPLHHIHGIINAQCCALWCGAAVEYLPAFEAGAVWNRLASGEITFFTAVPTVYSRLIAAWEAADDATRTRWSGGARSLRLMCSGSAALPAGVLARWEELTGHRLLERYGMTEIGMGLSNPYRGERRPGTVGQPLPGVTIRLTDETGALVRPGQPGQIEVRGPQVFREYWQRPEETRRAFRDGWFLTGDIASCEADYYRIHGRQSVDIIKSAGYKISALEIEEQLRDHPAVADCAVVGLPDPELGERIAAAVLLNGPATSDPDELKAWLRTRLAPYKVPRDMVFPVDLPRNAMGKVTKVEVRRLFD